MTQIQNFFEILKLQNKPKILRVLTLKLRKKRARTIHLNSYRLLETVLTLDFNSVRFRRIVSHNFGAVERILVKWKDILFKNWNSAYFREREVCKRMAHFWEKLKLSGQFSGHLIFDKRKCFFGEKKNIFLCFEKKCFSKFPKLSRHKKFVKMFLKFKKKKISKKNIFFLKN